MSAEAIAIAERLADRRLLRPAARRDVGRPFAVYRIHHDSAASANRRSQHQRLKVAAAGRRAS
jgi:hypothetical protein